MTWPEAIAKELPRDPKGIPLYRDKEKVLSTVAAMTTRGMQAAEFRQIGNWMADVLENPADEENA